MRAHQMPELSALTEQQCIEVLMEEIYGKEHELGQLTLSQIDTLFAQSRKIPEHPSMQASYLECVRAYCLLIQRLEMSGQKVSGNAKLYEIRENETKTQISKKESHAPEAPLSPPESPLTLDVPLQIQRPKRESEFISRLLRVYQTSPLLESSHAVDRALLSGYQAKALLDILEIQTADVVHKAFTLVYPKRKMCYRFLDFSNEKWNLKKSVQMALASMAKQHQAWLCDNKLSIAPIAQSLFFLGSIEKPSYQGHRILDLAVWIFFLGQAPSHELGSTTQSLQVSGLSEAQIRELFLKVLKIHRMKKKHLEPEGKLDGQKLIDFFSTIQSILQLTSKLHLEDSSYNDTLLEKELY